MTGFTQEGSILNVFNLQIRRTPVAEHEYSVDVIVTSFLPLQFQSTVLEYVYLVAETKRSASLV